MIAELEAAWPTFKTSVTDSAAATRNTPSPPPDIDAKGFWRIKADWSLDSDGDGIPDYLEFRLRVAGKDANGLTGDAFNADSDSDGVPDGDQLDSDGDGTPDTLDADKDDDLIAYSLIAEPRYAMFETLSGAFRINDRGYLLYNDRTWKNGNVSLLDTQSLEGFRVLDMNDLDQIIGWGDRTLPDYGLDVFVTYWADPTAGWTRVTANTQNGVIDSFPYPDYPQEGESILTNYGRFKATSVTKVNDVIELDPAIWILPSSPGQGFSYEPTHNWLRNMADGGLRWGHEYVVAKDIPPALERHIEAPGSPPPLDFDPSRLLPLYHPGDSEALLATDNTSNYPAKIFKDGVWREAGKYSNAIDMATDGTAIGSNPANEITPPEVMLNGRWKTLERIAPSLPLDWKIAAYLTDINPSGWILANRYDHSAALLPLRLEGIAGPDMPGSLSTTRATGVDGTSVGASTPDPAAADRLWIMAPSIAGETAVNVRAPAHSTAPIRISAGGITFNGQAEFTLSGGVTPVTIKATGNGSGAEILADISIGDNHSITRPIGFKVMKARSIRIAVYLIYKDNGTSLDGPDLIPTQEFIEDYLRKTYLRQINVDFSVVRVDNAVVVDWDTNGNGSLDTSAAKAPPSPEMQAVMDAVYNKRHPLNPADIAMGPTDEPDLSVFLLGGHKLINGKAVGVGHPLSATVWLVGDPVGGVTATNIPNTAAHEIGHIFFGEGHPNQGSGPAPLPGTDQRDRLMYSAEIMGARPNVKTVKGEWDAADLNIQELKDNSNLSN